jgi:hypothetical protein
MFSSLRDCSRETSLSAVEWEARQRRNATSEASEGLLGEGPVEAHETNVEQEPN